MYILSTGYTDINKVSVLSVSAHSCSSARHARRLHSAICAWRVPHWPVVPTAAAASASEQCGWQPSIEPVVGNAQWHERVCVSVPAPHVAEHCVAATQSVQTPAQVCKRIGPQPAQSSTDADVEHVFQEAHRTGRTRATR